MGTPWENMGAPWDPVSTMGATMGATMGVLEVLVQASEASTPCIGAAFHSELSLRVHRIPRVFLNERQSA